MINSLQLENYRGFEQYEISPLGRVNLLVGMNNCGKTSVLEAIQLMALSGSPSALKTIATQRGELIFKIEDSEGPQRISSSPEIKHFFHGHELNLNTFFSVKSDSDLGDISVRIVEAYNELKEQNLFADTEISPSGLGVITEHKLGNSPIYPLGDDGSLPREIIRQLNISAKEKIRVIPIQFISSESLDSSSMREIWDTVLIENLESDVVKVMKIIEPDLSQIIFLSGNTPRFIQKSRAGILVSFEGSKQRVPLGSLGDGMRRLLALALAFVRSKDGILLLDEIDTGLHYSIMGDMWRLVVEAAVQNNIQVFATTHSHDCVKGLSWLCANHPDLKKEVFLHTIDHPRLKKAVTIDGDEIVKTIDLGIEVR